jgi:calcineurin-like phosphoesterase family protein
MKSWITADLHFGHHRIMDFCPDTRPFKDTEDMNQSMIREWNETVEPGDTVYILGDFAFLPSNKAVAVLNQLNGDKILIEGNHDRTLLKDPVFRHCFKEVHSYYEMTYNKTFVVMFHYPVFDHNRAGHGSIMLHGHRHGQPTGIPGRIMDVGYDATGKIVVEIDEVIQKMKLVDPIKHH